MANGIITHIHLYTGIVTKGGVDGRLVSEGDHSSPLVIGALNIGIAEVSSPVLCSLRCDKNITTTGITYVSLTGNTASNWQLAKDNATSDPNSQTTPLDWGAWGAPLTIADIIGDTNYTFWVRARAVAADIPGKDAAASIQINANLYGA